MGTRIMPRNAPSADLARVYALIPIAVFKIIDAGTASASPFQRLTIIVHDHAGIHVHAPLESEFAMRWNPRSSWTGIITLILAIFCASGVRQIKEFRIQEHPHG